MSLFSFFTNQYSDESCDHYNDNDEKDSENVDVEIKTFTELVKVYHLHPANLPKQYQSPKRKDVVEKCLEMGTALVIGRVILPKRKRMTGRSIRTRRLRKDVDPNLKCYFVGHLGGPNEDERLENERQFLAINSSSKLYSLNDLICMFKTRNFLNLSS